MSNKCSHANVRENITYNRTSYAYAILTLTLITDLPEDMPDLYAGEGMRIIK